MCLIRSDVVIRHTEETNQINNTNDNNNNNNRREEKKNETEKHRVEAFNA